MITQDVSVFRVGLCPAEPRSHFPSGDPHGGQSQVLEVPPLPHSSGQQNQGIIPIEKEQGLRTCLKGMYS